MTLLLSRNDLEALLDLDDVIQAVERAFAAYSSKRADVPLRGAVHPPGTEGVLLSMPCALSTDQANALGTKVVSVFRANAARGLPTVTSLYLLSDYETGVPLAVMDGAHLTAIRTAAGSAVATKHLARPDARTLGVFGTGVQARFHVLALCRVRTFSQILVAGTSVEKARSFAGWAQRATGIPAASAAHADASAADVLAVCTTSPTPVVSDTHVRPGAHVNAVGAFTPTTRELPSAVVARSRVYVDSRAGAFSEAGDLLIPVEEGAFSLDRVAGELGELILERVPDRIDGRQVTIYKSVGAAFLDAATARLAYDAAVARRVGTQFAFS